jgi:hypothetical protein
VAEQGCLLSSYPDKIGIGGSNPPLSATPYFRLHRKTSMAPAPLSLQASTKNDVRDRVGNVRP